MALTPKDAVAAPTKSASHTSRSNVAPASSPFSNPAPKTTYAHAPTPKQTGSAESAVQESPAGSSFGEHDQAPQDAPKTTRSSGDNVWPLPPTDLEPPDTTDALSVLASAQASAAAAQIAASLIASAAMHQSEGAGEGADAGAHQGQDSEDPIDSATNNLRRPTQTSSKDSDGSINHAGTQPVRPTQTSLVWTQEGEVFTAVFADGSAKIQGAGATTAVANGHEAVFEGQKIRVSPEGDRIEVNGAALSVDPTPDAQRGNEQGVVTFQASDQIITAVPQDGSLVLQAAGAAMTVAYGDRVVFAGDTMSLPFSDRSAINVNGQWVTMLDLNRDSNAVIPTSTVWTQGGETFTARMQSGSAIVVEAAGTTRYVTAGSIATLGDTIFSVPSPGGVLVHDGTSITLNGATATDSSADPATSEYSSPAVTVLDSGSSVVIEMGDRTFTLADGAQTTIDGRVISAESTGGAIVVDGTATIEVSTRSTTARTSESSNFGGTEESTGTTMDAQSAGYACRSSMGAAMILGIASFLLILLW